MASLKDKLRQFWPQCSRFPYSLTFAMSIGFPLHRTDFVQFLQEGKASIYVT